MSEETNFLKEQIKDDMLEIKSAIKEVAVECSNGLKEVMKSVWGLSEKLAGLGERVRAVEENMDNTSERQDKHSQEFRGSINHLSEVVMLQNKKIDSIKDSVTKQDKEILEIKTERKTEGRFTSYFSMLIIGVGSSVLTAVIIQRWVQK